MPRPAKSGSMRFTMEFITRTHWSPLEDCPIPGETQFPVRRWVVERTFGWLAKRRSLRVRWCKKADNWLGFIHLACALLDMAVYR